MENQEKDIYKTPENTGEEKQKLIVDLTMAEARRRTIRAILVFVFVVALLLLLMVVYLVPGDRKKDEPIVTDEVFEIESRTRRMTERAETSDSLIDPRIEAMAEAVQQQDRQLQRETTVNPQQAAEAMGQMRLARGFFEQKQWDPAEEHVRKALELHPGMNAAQRMLGVIYTHRGQFDQAIAVFEQALTTDPFSAETYNNLATAYMQHGKMDKAEELLLDSLRMNPDYVLSFLNLGLLYLAQGEYELAASYFERALPSVPGEVNVRNNYAVALIRLGRYQEAREQLKIIISQQREMPAAYFNGAITYALEGNTQKAIEWIEDGAQHCSPIMLQRFLSDSDFDAIREDPAFQYIVDRLAPRLPQGPQIQ
jgi:pentatricopeptide repeat protein